MNLSEAIEQLNWEVIAGQDLLNTQITGGYCSDLLSDVMGNANNGQVWFTIQVHKNIVAVASLKELSAIVLVKGLKAADDTIKTAKEEGVVILQTKEPAFESAGKLYKLIEK